MKWARVLLLCLCMLCALPWASWSQSSSSPDSSPVITISYSDWQKINDYVKRLEKLNLSQSNETASLKLNSKRLLEQVALLQEQLRASLITNEELRAELEKVRQSLEDLEKSSKGLEQGFLRLQTERDIAIAGCVVFGVAAAVATVFAIAK